MRITAAVLRQADGDYRLEEVELADPGPDEVLVRVVGAAMCHTDVLPRSPGSCSPSRRTASAANRQRGQPSYCETFLLRNLLGRNLDGSTGVTDRDGNEISSRGFGQSSFATSELTP